MYLSIDLGDKRCGLAIEVEGIIMPKGIVLRPKLIGELKKLIKSYNVTTIVVGLPYDLHGKNLKQLDKTEVFIEKLKNILTNINIEGIDERFTSFEADCTLDLLGIKDKQGKKDDISAVLILESYFKQKGI